MHKGLGTEPARSMEMPIPMPGEGFREEAELEASLDCRRDDENSDMAGEREADESVEGEAGDTGGCNGNGYGRP